MVGALRVCPRCPNPDKSDAPAERDIVALFPAGGLVSLPFFTSPNSAFGARPFRLGAEAW